MFIEALLLSIIIGFLFKGKLNNLGNLKINNVYIVFVAFLIEAVIIFLIKKNVIQISIETFFADIIMYMIIFYFVYSNRQNPWIVIMGIGFLLNAVAIFSNGGAMPVSKGALEIAGLNYNNITREGLYSLINNNTKFWFLGDIIPKTFLRKFVVSIGDLISVIGLMMFIITGMKKSNVPSKQSY